MRMSVQLLLKFLADRRGSMTVEFIAIVPLFIAALLFGFEFGRAFWAYDVVTRDVRAAVRYLSRATPYNAAAQTQATNVAKTGLPGGTALHFPWTNAATVVYSEATFSAADYN